MIFRLSAIAVFALVLGAIGVAIMVMRPSLVQADDFAKRYVVVNPPRQLPLFQFEDDQGITHDLRDFKGRYILLNLWATWCGPCVEEMPTLNSLQNKFDYRRMNVVALNEDRNGVAAAQAFYMQHSLKRLPVYVDTSGRAPSLLHASGFPLTLLINPKGFEIGYIEGGAEWNTPATVAFLESKMPF